VVSDAIAVGGKSVRPLSLRPRIASFVDAFKQFLCPLPEFYPRQEMEVGFEGAVEELKLIVCVQQYFPTKELARVLGMLEGQKGKRRICFKKNAKFKFHSF
jgi:hypothetical protein